ncbi:kinase-like domain-containing protein [Lentinula edodes]|nr:kinase-like domain-containing protein [Lentinula edodes]
MAELVSNSALFVKETPSAPAGSTAEVIQLTNLFYQKEHDIYQRLGDHPRILRHHGWDERGLLFDRHPAGDLLRHLLIQRDPSPSLALRLRWACDIAEGLAYIHSKGVIWVDVNLHNSLLTRDQRVVLCDFAGSCMLNLPGEERLPFEYNQSQISMGPLMHIPLLRLPHARIWEGPGSPYPHPDWNFTPHMDRFAFGVVLFCLITFHFPHSPFLVVVDPEEVKRIYQLHQEACFDTLGEVAEYKDFEAIIQKCFQARYHSTDDLLHDLEVAVSGMPANAPLLQDGVKDPVVVEFDQRSSNRRLFPFPHEEDLDYYDAV